MSEQRPRYGDAPTGLVFKLVIDDGLTSFVELDAVDTQRLQALCAMQGMTPQEIFALVAGDALRRFLLDAFASADGKQLPAVDRCEFCRCTTHKPCEGGCAWSDEARRVCTRCAIIAEEWRQLNPGDKVKPRPFFRGFAAGLGDPRAIDDPRLNPYPVDSRSGKAWRIGLLLSAKGLEVRKAR